MRYKDELTFIINYLGTHEEDSTGVAVSRSVPSDHKCCKSLFSACCCHPTQSNLETTEQGHSGMCGGKVLVGGPTICIILKANSEVKTCKTTKFKENKELSVAVT